MVNISVEVRCRLSSPQRVREVMPTASSVDQALSCIPFLDASERDNLKEELPAYIARVAKDFDPLEWLKLNAPYWSAAAKKYYWSSHLLLPQRECFRY